MSLIQNHIVPLLPPQDCRVLEREGIRSDADVVVMFIVPPPPKLLSTFGAAVVAQDLEPWEELLELHFPV